MVHYEKQLLYCPGIPGAGKTVLCSVAIECLEQSFANNNDIGITYIFFDFRQQLSLFEILAALLRQLLQGKSKKSVTWSLGRVPKESMKLEWIQNEGETDVPGKYKTCCSGLQGVTGLDDLENALAVFVREMRMQRQGKQTPQNQRYQLEEDSSWVRDLVVQVHGSVTCWRRDGKDPTELDRLVKEVVRCSPDWQGDTGVWRKDCVWIQEGDGGRGAGPGQYVGELLLILLGEPKATRALLQFLANTSIALPQGYLQRAVERVRKDEERRLEALEEASIT